MTKRSVPSKIFHFPATVLTHLSGLLLGSYKKYDDKNNPIKRNQELSPKTTRRGLLSYVTDFIKYLGISFTNTIKRNQTAVAAAFWTSLLLAGAAALTVFLWPAALTAIATFSIAGVSIAGLVGTGLLAQIGVIAALVFVAASVLTYLVAGVVNFCRWAKGSSNQTEEPLALEATDDELFVHDSSTKKILEMSPTSKAQASPVAANAADVANVPNHNLFKAAVSVPAPAVEDAQTACVI